MNLVLASTSVYRLAQLRRLGLEPVATAHRCDESAFKVEGLAPKPLALRLAEEKARSIAADHADALILGSDQVLAFEGEILGKPGSVAKAEAQLARLSGKTHELITALALLHPDGRCERHSVTMSMRMRSLDAAEIARYVAHDKPIDCCGAYKIESLGISLFEAISGDDFSSIEGMPLMALGRMLRSAGVPLP